MADWMCLGCGGCMESVREAMRHDKRARAALIAVDCANCLTLMIAPDGPAGELRPPTAAEAFNIELKLGHVIPALRHACSEPGQIAVIDSREQ